MKNTELTGFRTTLENFRLELEAGIRNRESLAIERSSDDLDRTQNASDRESALGNLERNSSRLQEVRHALRRLDAGEFGICVDCGEDINLRRLAAVPWAPTCIVCQEATDRKRTDRESKMDASFVLG